jgi:hypothetical protein
MRGRISLLGLLVALLALCLVRGTAAQAQAMESWQQTTFTFPDQCRPGQDVAAVLTIHTVMQTVTDANGGFHQVTTVDTSGTGVSTDGTQYVIHESAPATGSTNGSETETTAVGEMQLITKGPAANSLVHFTFHTTWNANCVTTAVVFHDTERCVG